MSWWLWVLAGLALLGAELLAPGGFFIFFFGSAALVVGALVVLGLGGSVWLQWLLFAALSIVSLLLFRRPLLQWVRERQPTGAVDSLEGDTAILQEDLAPGAVGKAELRGTSWSAQNADTQRLTRGPALPRRPGGGPDPVGARAMIAGGITMNESLIVAVVVAVLVIIVIWRTAVVVPQQSAYVVERLGKFNSTLAAGFHILLPFLDSIRYRHSLKETAVDIAEQVCITRDNVQVHVDGVLYLKVLNPERASYGVTDYLFAISQLAQTTLRSEVGKIDLDRTFEERTHINTQVVNELDKASDPWGIKVLRYEIKNISPPKDVLAAMEKQMRAEREKRAMILTSEGERDAAINTAEGQKQQVIKASEAKRQQQINEAEGGAAAILAIAAATSEGIRRVAESIQAPGGYEAVQLRVAEQYIQKFGELANATDTTMIVPASVADVSAMLATAMNVIARQQRGNGAPPSPPESRRS